MIKRIVLICITGCFLLISGCNAKQNDAEALEQNKPIELRVLTSHQWKGVYWSTEENAQYNSFLKYAADQFTKQYDNEITIIVEDFDGSERKERVDKQRGTKNAPDVLFDSFFTSEGYAHSGWAIPLNDIIDEKSRDDISNEIWEGVTINNNIYCYPFIHMPNTLIYNKNLFRMAGLERFIPEENKIANWTKDNLKTILEVLKNNLPSDCYPMNVFAGSEQADAYTMTLLRMFGCPFINDQDTVELYTPEGLAALAWLKDFYDKGYFPENAPELVALDATELFVQGKVGISFSNTVLFHDMEAKIKANGYEEFPMGLATIPQNNTGQLMYTYITGCTVFDNQDSEKIKVAKDFVKFVCTDEKLMQASGNGIPVRKSVVNKYKDMIPYLESYENNNKYLIDFTGHLPNYNQMREYFYPNIQKLLKGELTPEETAMNIQEKCNASIQSGKVDSVLYK